LLRNPKKQRPDCPKGDDLRNELRSWELAREMSYRYIDQNHYKFCWRWEDGVMGDAMKLRERQRRNAARNRDRWRKLLRKALTQSGLLCQWWWWWYWIKITLHVSGINSPSSGGKVYVCCKWYF
jgi:hypothetical protein